jgi:hypothetical protein
MDKKVRNYFPMVKKCPIERQIISSCDQSALWTKNGLTLIVNGFHLSQQRPEGRIVRGQEQPSYGYEL